MTASAVPSAGLSGEAVRRAGVAVVAWAGGRAPLAAGAGAAGLLAPPVVLRAGTTGQALVGSFLVTVLALLTVVDLRERRLPNRIVVPAAVLVLGAQLALAPDRTLEWLVSGVAAALFFLVPLLVWPPAVGMGDVKLAFLLGVALGSAVVVALFVAAILGALAASVVLVAAAPEARTRYLPFGPFLAIGAVVALILQSG